MEELTKSEISSMIDSRDNSLLSSNKFKEKIKEIVADAMSDLFKTLYQRDSSWKSGVK